MQIDGLSRAQFERALAANRMPFLKRLIQRERYEVHTFYPGMPSTTPAVQAELYYGVKSAVPAFSFFDRVLKEEVVKMKEKNTNTLFLLMWLGYDFVTIPYKRAKREVGKSRWTFSKKLKLFIDSFVAFSFFPIRLISVVGLLLGAVSLLYGIYILISKLAGRIEVQGWTSMMVVFLFVSSFQTIALGIIGEYIWRTLDASRKRPLFIIEEIKRT